LGVWLVIGFSLVPFPAAKIIAFNAFILNFILFENTISRVWSVLRILSVDFIWHY